MEWLFLPEDRAGGQVAYWDQEEFADLCGKDAAKHALDDVNFMLARTATLNNELELETRWIEAQRYFQSALYKILGAKGEMCGGRWHVQQIQPETTQFVVEGGEQRLCSAMGATRLTHFDARWLAFGRSLRIMVRDDQEERVYIVALYSN